MFIWYGLAGVFIIVLFSITKKTDWFEDLCVAAFIMGFLILLIPLAPIEAYLRPLTWDSRLYNWDTILGIDIISLTRWCESHPWTIAPITVIYCSLPLMLALNWAIERSSFFLKAAAIGGLLAVPFYLLVPACGPQYAFAGYPWHAIIPTGLIAITDHPRNCFPSMHFSWALLMAFNARGRIWKSTLWIYALMIGFTAVAGGEHYFIDLIAAIPFSLSIQYIATYFLRPASGRAPIRSNAISTIPASNPKPMEN